MELKIEDLIGRGYFPKELPPPFNTIDLANNYSMIKNKWQNPENSLVRNSGEDISSFSERKSTYNKKTRLANKRSKCGIYSITKSLLCRRYLSIPNPIHYIKLSKCIVENWDKLEPQLANDSLSMSSPIFQKSLIDRCFRTRSERFVDFVTKTLDLSFKHTFELRLDISMFYHRIYTHSIPWALLGKDRAKQVYNNIDKFKTSSDSRDLYDYKMFVIGDEIDVASRATQEDQTIGIPVGPDTSLIIAELILAQVDKFVERERDISACRYFDDYYIYTNSKERADEVLKKVEQILYEYNLEINESKVSIKEYPFHFVEDFSIELRNFNLNNNFEYSIKQYFSIVWKFASHSPHKKNQIFNYSFAIFDSAIFDRKYFNISENWEIFEDLMLKSLLTCPSIIEIVYRIILRRFEFSGSLTKRTSEKLHIIISSIIDSHAETNESFEVSWCLWMCKIFKFDITKEQASKILLMRDSISRLILLDIINSGTSSLKQELIVELRTLCKKLVQEGLLGSNWLLLYEGVLKGWLNINSTRIKRNHYFKILYETNISFYDSDASLRTQTVEYVFDRRKMNIKLRREAKEQAEELFYKIIKEQAEKQYEEDSDDLWFSFFGKDEEEIKNDKQKRILEIEEELRKDPEYIDLKENLFNSILDKKASDKPIDETELFETYLSQLNHYSTYK